VRSQRIFRRIHFTSFRTRGIQLERIAGTFAGDPETAREALRTLLGTRRLRVGPDPDRGFRVEDLLYYS
jgi:hypothetical protein